ncbi:restriction endonuclease subunit S [Bacillus altitudinis]|uniref:restriction endonuclease subunit S n=1 Tax=Bacillus altitudinis TaxID=293387 RepID=UPI002349267B|nr:restriction endonuclease subunit S [Bacillus altitudinis]
MSDKIKKSPKIRFAGFTDAWEQCKLGGISEKVTEKNKDNNYSETLTNSAELGIINQRDFFDKDISNKKNLDGYYVVRPDDFVYNPRISNFAPVGPIKRNNLGRTGIMSPLYYVFRTHDVDKTYLEKYFSSNSWHIFMKLNGDSGARSDRFAIKDSVFREMPIPIPSVEEQAKIGTFFKQLDNFITLHQRKLELLKDTKKSLLQKMFPKDGANVPEIRFGGFADAWEQRELKDVVDVRSGRDYKHLSDGDIPVYGTGGYMLSVNEALSYDKDAIGIGRKGTIDKPYLLRAPFWTVDTLFYVVPKEKNNLDFVHSVFQRVNWKQKDESTGVPSLSKTTINAVNMAVPECDEQAQIGHFFSQLDNLITLHQRELNSLKNLKKSLLQQMFI